MSPEDATKKLVDIQTGIDSANIDVLKEEHELKLKHFNRLRSTFSERDALIEAIDGFGRKFSFAPTLSMCLGSLSAGKARRIPGGHLLGGESLCGVPGQLQVLH